MYKEECSVSRCTQPNFIKPNFRNLFLRNSCLNLGYISLCVFSYLCNFFWSCNRFWQLLQFSCDGIHCQHHPWRWTGHLWTKQGTEHRKHKPSTQPPQQTGFLSNKSPHCKNALFACSKPNLFHIVICVCSAGFFEIGVKSCHDWNS